MSRTRADQIWTEILPQFSWSNLVVSPSRCWMGGGVENGTDHLFNILVRFRSSTMSEQETPVSISQLIIQVLLEIIKPYDILQRFTVQFGENRDQAWNGESPNNKHTLGWKIPKKSAESWVLETQQEAGFFGITRAHYSSIISLEDVSFTLLTIDDPSIKLSSPIDKKACQDDARSGTVSWSYTVKLKLA